MALASGGKAASREVVTEDEKGDEPKQDGSAGPPENARQAGQAEATRPISSTFKSEPVTKSKVKARSGRVLNFVVEDSLAQDPALRLPDHVRQRWSVRLAEAASGAAAMGKPWKAHHPPLPWYAVELMRVCTGTTHLSSQLMALQAQRSKRSWMWKDGPLARMLASCGDMLTEASSVIESVSAARCSHSSSFHATLRAMRERCLPAYLSEPTVPPCLSCTAEEAMSMTQTALTRLRGAGAALSLALRLEEPGFSGVVGEGIQQDFFILVPVVEMTLSNLGWLTKLVFLQLERDLSHVPAETAGAGGGPFADPSMKSIVGSPSINSAWAEQESQVLDEAVQEEDPRTTPSQPAQEELEGASSAKASNRNARAALQEERFFDGVQLVNTALEAQGQALRGTKGGYSAAPASTEADGTEILRTPEVFLNRVMTTLTAAKKNELADFFTVRTDLLVGLGALKRAVVDVSAALLLRPEDEALARKKTDLEGRLAGDTGLGAATKTPTSIITGFLGAGKTTLLNYILEQNHGKKIAIIENEFGEVGIDDALLNTKSAVTEENVIEMNNGCICCTVRGDLIAGLKKLHKQTTGKGKPLDGIIIETTGLADPAPVAQTFFADDFVSANMVLDGILTVVDSKHIIGQLQEDKPEGAVNEAVEQIAFADRILLNKTDLVSDAELDEVQREVRRINKTAAMKRTVFAIPVSFRKEWLENKILLLPKTAVLNGVCLPVLPVPTATQSFLPPPCHPCDRVQIRPNGRKYNHMVENTTEPLLWAGPNGRNYNWLLWCLYKFRRALQKAHGTHMRFQYQSWTMVVVICCDSSLLFAPLHE
ncbi:Cbwd1 [Symbiodinium sp. CCMP2456]|nr:Cbwd1 [Symbiodinium sp. CCMP2456]